ncbi:MAG: hypothetical protein NTX12_00250, partial [Actinobacteria bacterium]|nr:hypothetical protein [Actinomycetota bacterium]
RFSRMIALAVAGLILIVGGVTLFSKSTSSDVNKVNGKVALSASELRDVVAAKKITAYWVGPLDGAKYTLNTTAPGVVVVRYLPSGVGVNDVGTPVRSVGTYIQNGAYDIAATTAASIGNGGGLNADGNSYFYSDGRPTNVYIGIKGKDIQVELFDPVANQAINLAQIQNQVRLIN